MDSSHCIFRLVTRADGFDSDNEFDDQYAAGYVCRGCSGVLPGTFPRPLDVRVRNDSAARVSATIGSVFTSGAALARRDFIAQLGPFIGPLAIGRVIGRDGTDIESHCTFYGPGEAMLRTYAVNPPQSARTCTNCGRVLAECWQGNDNGFVLEADVRGRTAWLSGQDLLVTPETLERLEISRWRDLKSERVAVARTIDEGRALSP